MAPEALVNWLRGQYRYEDRSEPLAGGTPRTTAERLFRKRTSALGDIVGSAPVYVKGPGFAYGDTGYAAFRDRYTIGPDAGKRTGTVYVGANDGMLHAFDAATLEERWALVPHPMLDALPKLASRTYAAQHRFFVDGTPTLGDVYDGAQWRTILVGGFNAGGEGYYAIDVTDEANPQRLWSFTNADLPAGRRDLGKSFGNPIITKRADTNQWVALITSGYNSATGRAVLYMVDATLGPAAGVTIIDTGADPGASELGLAKISNWVDNTRLNNATKFVYGGDLKGNVWRFDITGATAVKIGELTAGGTPLPITTAPELAKRTKPTAAAMVILTTGKYLDVSDYVTAAGAPKQGVFALADDQSSASPAVKHPGDLDKCVISETVTRDGAGKVTAVKRTSSCTGASTPDPDGWYMELPNDGERITIAPRIQLGTLVFISNVPATDPCEGGGGNVLHYLDFETGGAVKTASDGGIASLLAGDLGVGFILVRMPNGTLRAVATTSDGELVSAPVPNQGGLPEGRRVSWRELNR